MKYQLLDNLNTILKILRGNFTTIGLTLAGVIGAIAIAKILLDHDSSPAARALRWEKLTLVFICVGLLSALLVLIGFVQQVAGGL